MLFLGVGAVFAIKGILFLDIEFFTDVKYYVIRVAEDEQLVDPNRLGAAAKWVALFGILLVSELLVDKNDEKWRVDVLRCRRLVFLFITPLIVFPEVFSRLSYYYFAWELIFVIWAFQGQYIRTRLAGATIFCAYGFAINAFNILMGSSWKSYILGVG